MQNYNIMALQGMDMSDEETANNVKIFPKQLLHSMEMNLWLTWYYHLTNVEASKNKHEADQGLSNQLQKMMIIFPHKLWVEIEIPFNNPLVDDYDPEWYLDMDNLISACMECFRCYPPELPGFVQSNVGFELTFEVEGKWILNPKDNFWNSQESLHDYSINWHRLDDLSKSEALSVLKKDFGEKNMPIWADKFI